MHVSQVFEFVKVGKEFQIWQSLLALHVKFFQSFYHDTHPVNLYNVEVFFLQEMPLMLRISFRNILLEIFWRRAFSGAFKGRRKSCLECFSGLVCVTRHVERFRPLLRVA
jgi:hypothetical protein